MPISTIRLRMPIRNRNVPETVGPIRPVAWCSAEPSFATPPLRPLMPTREPDREQEDDRRVAEREEEADAQRPLAVAHQLARGVVDRADVVGVEGVAHAERVGRDADADAEDAACRARRCCGATKPSSRPKPTTCSATIDEGEPAGAPPLGRRERARDAAPIARLLPATPLLPSDCSPRIVSRTSYCEWLARANQPHQTSSTHPFVRSGRSVRWGWSGARFPLRG